MSSIARWSYTNTATVKPLLSFDLDNQTPVYGDEYTIACTWAAESKEMRDKDGKEFVSGYVIWSEDPRPKYLDLIKLNTLSPSDWQEIRAHMEWDMSMFGDTPDYRTVTDSTFR